MANSLYNPDCGYGWVVVGACFAINFIMSGLSRAAGVLYVALIDAYGVSREIATTPFSLRFCIRNLSGPLVGALGQHFGIRPVVLFGGLIGGLGGILSALAPDVTWITAAWGGLHGLGCGMSNLIHLIIVNRYFDKYKGLAIGVSLTGDCFGTFLLPLLLEILLPNYGIQGTFLILAGITLNIVPAALLLVPPVWEIISSHNSQTDNISIDDNKNCKQGIVNEAFENTCVDCDNKLGVNNMQYILPTITINGTECNQNSIKTQQVINEEVKNLQDPKKAYMRYLDFHFSNGNKNKLIYDSMLLDDIYSLRQSVSLRVTDKTAKRKRFSCGFFNMNTQNRRTSDISVLSCPSHGEKSILNSRFLGNINDLVLLKPITQLESIHCPPCQTSEEGKSITLAIKEQNNANELFTVTNTSDCNEWSLRSQSVISVMPLQEEKFSELEIYERTLSTQSKGEDNRISTTKNPSPFLKFLKTNIKPIFLVINASLAFYVFLFISVFTIIIDYSVDNNIPRDYGKYLIIAFSVADVFGRVGFGVVLDRKWIALSHFAGTVTGLMGLFVLVIPFYKCFYFWMISFSLCGFVQGGAAIMYPILVEYYMDKDEESVALGSLNFYGGVLMLPIPAMVGYFRDNIGSYDGVFWTVGALCILAGSLWILEPCLTRKKKELEPKKILYG